MSRYTYSSAGIKTQVLERYVVMHQINAQYGGAAGMIYDAMDKKFNKSATDVWATTAGADLLKDTGMIFLINISFIISQKNPSSISSFLEVIEGVNINIIISGNVYDKVQTFST